MTKSSFLSITFLGSVLPYVIWGPSESACKNTPIHTGLIQFGLICDQRRHFLKIFCSLIYYEWIFTGGLFKVCVHVITTLHCSYRSICFASHCVCCFNMVYLIYIYSINFWLLFYFTMINSSVDI